MKKLKTKIRELKKWSKKGNNLYYIIGTFFLLSQLLVFLGNYNSQNYDVFFWFCNHTPLFFAIAFFLKKKHLIKGLINVGFLGQFAWTLDFLGKIFFDVYILSMTNYVFENPTGLWILLPIIIHIFATNVALFFTYKKRPTIHTLFYSLLYIMFLYTSTLAFTLEETNVNWVHQAELDVNLDHDYYTIFWPLITFFLVVMPTQGIQYLLYIHRKRKKKKSLTSHS